MESLMPRASTPSQSTDSSVGDLTVVVERSSSVFGLSSWQRLADRVAHPFARPEWHSAWWTCFGEGLDLLVLRAQRGSHDVAVVPLCLSVAPVRTLSFLGGAQLTDYLGPVCDEASEGDVARAVVAWLVDGDERHAEIDFRFMAPTSPFTAELVRALKVAGREARAGSDDVVSRIPLPTSWHDYTKALPKKERHELCRKQRRFDAHVGSGAILRRATPETAAADIELFVALHRASRGAKNAFMTAQVAAFFRLVAPRYLELGMLDLSFLELQGRAIAAAMSFVCGGRYFLYNMAYDARSASLSPGVVLVASLIRRAIAEGSGVYDLLRGGEDYKKRLGGRLEELVRVRSPAAVPAPA